MAEALADPHLTNRPRLADSPELRDALVEANLHTLLAAYTFISHDRDLLERFAPFIRPAFSPEYVEIPGELATELRKKLHRLLTTGNDARDDAPSDELVQRIMSVTAGEPVTNEFLALV